MYKEILNDNQLALLPTMSSFKREISEISSCATQLYGDLFSEKLFRSQLCFFDDIDYSESVDFIIPSPPSEETIKKSLTAIAVQGV